MSYTAADAEWDQHYDELQRLFEEGLKNQAQEAVKSYLGTNGDAVDRRVLASIDLDAECELALWLLASDHEAI